MAFFKNKGGQFDFSDLTAVLVEKPKPVTPPTDAELIEPFKLNMVTGPWVAGGAALAWYLKQPVRYSDIDIFTANLSQQHEAIRQIEKMGGQLAFDSPSAKTYEMRSTASRDRHHTVQVIVLKHFASAQDIIDNFDISVCRIVTDGEHFVLGEGTAYDIHNKILRMKTPLSSDAVKRMIKYWCYGYTPTDELLNEIIEDPNVKWDFAGQEGDYLNAF